MVEQHAPHKPLALVGPSGAGDVEDTVEATCPTIPLAAVILLQAYVRGLLAKRQLGILAAQRRAEDQEKKLGAALVIHKLVKIYRIRKQSRAEDELKKLGAALVIHRFIKIHRTRKQAIETLLAAQFPTTSSCGQCPSNGGFWSSLAEAARGMRKFVLSLWRRLRALFPL